METSLFKKYEGIEFKRTRRTERGDLLELFLSRLNPPRREVKLKELSVSFLSRFFKDRRMNNHQVYCFYQDCLKAKNFSSFFWYETKVQKKQVDS